MNTHSVCLSAKLEDMEYYTTNHTLSSYEYGYKLKNRILKCEYCKSETYFDYKEFDCKKCGAPLKIAKPFD